MVKRSKSRPQLKPISDAEIDAVIAEAFPVTAPAPSALHDLFDQQVRAVMDAADLDEEQKQNILVAMSCPCCGGGNGMLTYKLKRRT